MSSSNPRQLDRSIQIYLQPFEPYSSTTQWKKTKQEEVSTYWIFCVNKEITGQWKQYVSLLVLLQYCTEQQSLQTARLWPIRHHGKQELNWLVQFQCDNIHYMQACTHTHTQTSLLLCRGMKMIPTKDMEAKTFHWFPTRLCDNLPLFSSLLLGWKVYLTAIPFFFPVAVIFR